MTKERKMTCKNCGKKCALYPDEKLPLTEYDDKFCSNDCFDEHIDKNPIVDMIKRRIAQGYVKYDKIMPINDGRDWMLESLEEILDSCVYMANQIILLKEKRERV